MCGIAGSGKSTYAQRLERDGYIRLSIDEEVWRSAGRYGLDYPPERYAKLAEDAERRLRGRLVEFLAADRDVVVDFSFWSKACRDEYKQLIEQGGGEWRLIYLNVPAAELRRRLTARAGRFDANAAVPIGDELLEHYLAVFEPPHGEGEEVVDVGSQ